MIYPKSGYIRLFESEYIHVIFTTVFDRIPRSSSLHFMFPVLCLLELPVCVVRLDGVVRQQVRNDKYGGVITQHRHPCTPRGENLHIQRGRQESLSSVTGFLFLARGVLAS
ncbi:unnamed protein product [Laminaria digitata]